MSGDHFPNKYFPERFFPGGYFQGGEQNPGAMSASLSGSGDITALLVGVQVQAEDTGGRGGWDPYYYKKRNKRRDKKKDVEAFVREIEQAPIEQAPAFIQEQAEEALEASRRALRLEELDALQKALSEINEFYSLVRVEAKRRREEEEDDELLLLS